LRRRAQIAASTLLAVAARASTPLAVKPPTTAALRRWVRALPEAEKDEVLLRLLRGEDAHLRADLLRRFHGPTGEPTAGGGRTAGELLAAAEELWAGRGRQRQGQVRERESAERLRREQAAAAVRGQRLDARSPPTPGQWARPRAEPGLSRVADAAPEFARRPARTLWIGPDHHLVHYPVSAGTLVNLVAFAPAGDYTIESWTATTTIREFLAEFEGWDERLTDLIRAAGTPGRWALLDRMPLAQWSRGGTTLLGDAAHPCFPSSHRARRRRSRMPQCPRVVSRTLRTIRPRP
jgi:hypothetical protein